MKVAQLSNQTVEETMSLGLANVEVVPDSLYPTIAELPVFYDDPVFINLSFCIKNSGDISKVKTPPIEVKNILEYFGGKVESYKGRAPARAGAITQIGLNAILSPLNDIMPSSGINGSVEGLATAISTAHAVFTDAQKKVIFNKWQKLCLRDPEAAASIAMEAMVIQMGRKAFGELISRKAVETISEGAAVPA